MSLKLQPRKISLAVLACLFPSCAAWANPQGPQVVHGQASFHNRGTTLNIDNSNGAIINWRRFSIDRGETTRFNQPSPSSAVLNRVQGGDPSKLMGTLSSNGEVLLINPAGVLVGKGGKIDVKAFTASTLNLSDENFKVGKLKFDATPGAGKVENQGEITTPGGGHVYLVGAEVKNQGLIQTPQGQAVLAAGDTVRIEDSATPGVSVEITGARNQATNLGRIVAQSGEVGVVGAMVRNAGVINANQAVKDASGRIFLKATQNLEIEKGSRISADAKPGLGAGAKAGNIALESAQGDVNLAKGASVAANGPAGGAVSIAAPRGHANIAGTVEAKGDQGAGGSIDLRAQTVRIATTGRLDVSGKTQGGQLNLGGKNGTVKVEAGARLAAVGAKGGKAILDTGTGRIDQAGRIDARGLRVQGGQVELRAATLVNQPTGMVQADGKTTGGHIEASAGQIEQHGLLSADGHKQGGTITVAATRSYTQSATGLLSARAPGGQGGGVIVASRAQAQTPKPQAPDTPAPDPSQTLIAGNIRVSGRRGGAIRLTGDRVGLLDNAALDASGTEGGGGIRVGGGYRGRDATVANAQAVFVAPTATVNANATVRGDGGTVIVWSDLATRAYGKISATGGGQGGDGGFVETSGHYLDTQTPADVSSAQGKPGTWLLDPNNIVIQATGGDTNVGGGPNFATTDDSAIIATGTIEAALNNGTSVVVTTGAAGANTQAGDITVASPIAKTAGGDATLTLSAHNNIAISANIGSTVGKLGLTLIPDADASGGGGANIAGAVDLNGGTLTLRGAASLLDGGIIKNGTLVASSAAPVLGGSGGGVLDGVTLGSDLTLGSNLFVKNNLVLADGTTLDVGARSLYFQGATNTLDTPGTARITLAGGWIYSYNGDGTLNLGAAPGSGLTVGGYGNFGAWSGTLALVNNGTLQAAGGTMSAIGLSSNAGVIDIASGAAFSTNNANLTNAATGVISGAGSLDLGSAAFTLTNNGGLRPGGGGAAGTLTILGNLVNGAGGTIETEIGGTTPGAQYDQINVSGTATLNGTLDATLLNGFATSAGQTFDIVSAAAINGGFQVSTLPGHIDGAIAGTSYRLTDNRIACASGICWDGDAGNFLWSDPLNWTTNLLPTGGDSVFIGALTSAVTLNSGNQSVLGLVCDANFVLADGGSLSVGADGASFNAGYTQSGGTLTGAGKVTLNGTATWTGGTMSGGGETLIAPGATLAVAGGGDFGHDPILDGRTLRNQGAGEWTSGDWNWHDGARLINEGQFALRSAMNIVWWNANTTPATLTNTGTLIRDTASTDLGIDADFNNSGTLKLDTGKLILKENSASTGGAFGLASGTTLLFYGGGSHSLDPASTLSGAGDVAVDHSAKVDFSGGYALTGQLKLTDSGAFNFNGDASLPSLSLDGGVLGGSGVVTVTDALTWTSGKMNGGGQTWIDSHASLDIGGTGPKTLGRGLYNRGAATWSGSGWDTDPGAYLQNQGTLSVSGDQTMDAPFDNEGAVSILSGTFDLLGNGAHTGGFDVAAGATLGFDLASVHKLANGSSLTGAGALRVAYWNTQVTIQGRYELGGDVAVDNGTLNFDSNATIPNLSLRGGTLGGKGTVAITGHFDWREGDLADNGTTELTGGNAVLDMNGAGRKGLIGDHRLILDSDASGQWTDGEVMFDGKARFENQGSFALRGDFVDARASYWHDLGSDARIENTGTITRDSGLGEAKLYVAFDNDGSVNLDSGTLILGGDGDDSGRYTVATGTVLDFAGGIRKLGGEMQAAGAVAISGADVEFNQDVSLPSLTLSDGVLGGSGRVTLTHDLTWTGGGMVGGGETVVASGASLSVAGTGNFGHDPLLDSRALRNQGTGAWSSGDWYWNDAAHFINEGQFSLASGGNLLWWTQTASPGLLTNSGTLTRDTATTALSINARIENSGVIEAKTSPVSFEQAATLDGAQAVLGGDGAITMNGPFTWGLGTVKGAGLLTTNGATTLDHIATLQDKTWVNTGHASLTDSAYLVLDDTAAAGVATLDNQGVIDMGSDATYPFFGNGDAVFNNSVHGTLNWNRSMALRNTSVLFVAHFDNSGIVVVNDNMTVRADGTDIGTYHVAAGKTLTFLGDGGETRAWNPGVAFSGTGDLVIERLTITVNTPLALGSGDTPAHLTLTNGSTLDAKRDLTLSGGFVWTGGQIQGVGVLTTTGTTTLDSGTANALWLNNKTWNNGGTLSLLNATQLYLRDEGTPGTGAPTLNNQPGGVINAESTHQYPIFGDGPSVFVNAGTLNWNRANPDTGYSQLFVGRFDHSGTANIRGSLYLDYSGGTDTGLYAVGAGSTLTLWNATRAWKAGAAFTGTGSIAMVNAAVTVDAPVTVGPGLEMTQGGNSLDAVADLALNGAFTLGDGGTVTAAGGFDIAGPFAWNGGVIQGPGLLTTTGATRLGGGAVLRDKTWNNAGTLTLDPAGTLNLDDTGTPGVPTLNNQAAGVFDMGSTSGFGGAGAFNNAGTLNWNAAATLNLSGPFDNGGTLNINDDMNVHGGTGSAIGAFVFATGKTLTLDGAVWTWNPGMTLRGAGGLTLSSSTLALNTPLTLDASTPTLSLTGFSTLDASADLTIQSDWSWTGDFTTIQGAGLLTTTGTTALSGQNAFTLQDKTWNNQGRLNLTGTAALRLNDTGAAGAPTLNNQAGATIDMASTGGIGAAAASAFDNAGSLNWNAAATLNLASFANSGVVNVNQDLFVHGGTGTDTGSYVFAAGKTLTWNGSARTWNPGLTLNGSGILILDSATLTLNTPLTLDDTAPSLTITGFSTVDASADLTIDSDWSWTGDYTTITGPGVLTTTGTTTLAGQNAFYLRDKTWNNSGTIDLAGTALLNLDDNAAAGIPTLNNRADGVFNMASTGGIGGGGASAFANAGKLNWRAAASINLADFDHSGTAQIDADLTLKATGTDTGVYNLATGKTLTFTLGRTFQGALNLGQDAVFDSSGQDFANAGTITGNGTLELGTGTLTNAGDIAPGLPAIGVSASAGSGGTVGTLSVNGQFVQTASGTLALDLDAPTAGGHDVLAVSGNASLDGNLVLSGLGGAGSYKALTAASLVGGFADVDTGGLLATPNYTGTGLIVGLNAPGTAINWDGGAGSLLWTDPLNWSTDTLPAGFNPVTIAALTGAVVLASGDQAVQGLTSHADFQLRGGRLSVGADGAVFNGALTLSGGSLDATGNIETQAAFTWTGGGLAGTGNYRFAQGFDYPANSAGTLDATGGVSIVQGGDLNLPAMPRIASLSAQAGGNIALKGAINAGGTGDAIVLAAGGSFQNNAGANALRATGGRWLVWSGDPASDNRGGLTYAFKQYNASFGTSAVLGGGDGFLYTLAPTATATLTGTVSKTYDGDNTATLSAANYGGVGVDGDTLAFNNPGSGSYDSKDAGTRTVTVGGIALAQASNGAATVYGYTLASDTASATIGNISRKTLSAGLTGVSKVYDGGTAAVLGADNFQLNGVVAGETIAVNQTGGSYDNRNVGGTHTVSASLASGDFSAGGGTDLNNYVLPTSAATAQGGITPAALTLTAATDSKVYDGSTASSGAVAVSGLIGSDGVTGLTQRYADKNVHGANASLLHVDGGYTLSDGNGGGNYIVTLRTAQGTITPAALALAAVTDSKVYDGTTASSGAVAVSGLIGSDGVTGLTQRYADKNVHGTNGSLLRVDSGYTLSDGNGGGNYSVSTRTAQGTITPRELNAALSGTVIAKTYDGTAAAPIDPANFTLSGLVSGDSVSLTGSGQYDGVNAGTHAVSFGDLGLNGADSGNYHLTTSTLDTAAGRIDFGLAAWSGAGGDNLWTNPLNWNIQGLPDANYNVALDALGTGNILLNGGGNAVHDLSGAASLQITGGSLSLEGTGTLGGLRLEGGELSGAGALSLTHDLDWSGGALSNTGGVTVAGAANLANTLALTNTLNASAVNNGGFLRIDQTGVLHLTGDWTNTGGLGGSGLIRLGAGQNTLTNQGHIAPGTSPGILHIDGDFAQGDNGVLEMQLDSTASAGFDQLKITGSAQLAGTVQVTGAAPVGNYPVLSANGGVDGKFATVDSAATLGIRYNAKDVTLVSGAAPPPNPPPNPNPGGVGGDDGSGSLDFQSVVAGLNVANSLNSSGGKDGNGNGMGYFVDQKLDEPADAYEAANTTRTDPDGSIGGKPGEFGGSDDPEAESAINHPRSCR